MKKIFNTFTRLLVYADCNSVMVVSVGLY